MKAVVLVSRIVAVVAALIALVLSFVERFVTVSFDSAEFSDVSASASAWNDTGVLGGLALMLALATSVVALVMGLTRIRAARVLDLVAAALLVGAAGLMAIFVLTTDLAAELSVGFGWSGVATLGLIAVAAVASVLAGARDSTPETSIAYGMPATEPPAYGTPAHETPAYAPSAVGTLSYGTSAGYPAPVPHDVSNDKALWSMVLGICSFFCCAPVTSIVAIVLSRQAMREIEQSGGTQSGAGQAKAGLILGIVSATIAVIVIAIYAFLLVVVTTTA